MALVVRYFGPTDGPDGNDGTTPAKRAALFSGGAWSTIISGFNFGGTDMLEARIMPGTYAWEHLSTTSVPSTTGNPLILHGADAQGNRIVPQYGWTSDQPVWDCAAWPLLASSSNVKYISNANVVFRCLSLGSSASTSNPFIGSAAFLDWCVVSCSNSNTSIVVVLNVSRITNCVLSCSGTAFAAVVQVGSAKCFNVRVEGGGASGTRHGINLTGTTSLAAAIERCCVVGVGGSGIRADHTAATGLAGQVIRRNTVVGVGGDGIYLQVAGTPAPTLVEDNCVTGCTGAGINGGGGFAMFGNNRLRNNTGGDIINAGNYPTDLDNYTAAGTDADEYADAAAGDYRIKASAAFANRGIGVSPIAAAAVVEQQSIY